jgi:hypothetical protein
MRRFVRSLTAPVAIAIGLILSSCMGAVVQSTFVPNDRGVALAGSAALQYAKTALYAQGTAPFTTTSGTDQAIPGLSLTLPAATTSVHNALVTFSAGATYPQGSGYCYFTIYNGTTATSARAATSDSSPYPSYIPANIVARIPLASATQIITVDVNNQNSGTCWMGIFYSLSAILTN